MLEKQNIVTIKKIKLWSLKKVFQNCYDKIFYFLYILFLKIFRGFLY